MRNIDPATVEGFGDEWTRFDQSDLSPEEKAQIFERYFHILPLPEAAAGWTGFDFGCGTGRWASLVAPRVKRLACIDASAEALKVARRNLSEFENCEFLNESVDRMSLAEASQDFGYSLGVLHHIPDTPAALAACVRKLKPGAPFLLYIYYAFDNRPAWFRLVWKISDLARRVVSRMPSGLKYAASQVIAATIYWPLARVAKVAAALGVDTAHWPLAFYASRSFYVMRNDALDRFGTRLEQRFTRAEIEAMMRRCGLDDIRFSDDAPFWCAVGYKT